MLVQYIQFDEKPAKKDILEALECGDDDYFNSEHSDFNFPEWIAEEILEQKHSDWEIYDEDESVFVVIIEDKERQKFHVFEVSPYFSLEFGSREVFLDDEDE